MKKDPEKLEQNYNIIKINLQKESLKWKEANQMVNIIIFHINLLSSEKTQSSE